MRIGSASRRPTLALLIAAAAMAGCGGAPAKRPRADRLPAGLAAGWKTDFARHSVPLGEFAGGGPGRDGIPPIDHPRPAGLRAGDAFLKPREPVIAVAVGRGARAYPIEILIWHEIVNDVLGGRPIAVTYCPLCNSALVFDRRVGATTLSFGTTGNLRNSDLVMWDRQTQSWWQQITGDAVVGRLTGMRLHGLDAQTLSWADFKARYPDGDVLSRDTGFQRPYGSNPYQAYDSNARERPFLYHGRLDGRLPAKERVVAVFARGETVVVPFDRLAREPVVRARIGDTPAVVLYKRGVISALDSGSIADGRDVGTVGVFDRRARGHTLDFRALPGGAFRDRQTGSRWDITGRALAGPLRGARLRALRHDEQFWFALAAFVPKARILGPTPRHRARALPCRPLAHGAFVRERDSLITKCPSKFTAARRGG